MGLMISLQDSSENKDDQYLGVIASLLLLLLLLVSVFSVWKFILETFGQNSVIGKHSLPLRTSTSKLELKYRTIT